MAKKDDENISSELAKVKEKLIKINQRVKKHLELTSHPSHILKKKSNLPNISEEKVSLQELHGKLKAINTYLQERIEVQKSVSGVSISEFPQIKTSAEKDAPERMGIGLDLGTSYIVTAREAIGRDVFIKRERNVSLSVKSDRTIQKLLTKLKMKYVSVANKMYILGDSAIDLANMFNREVQRPMSRGILNPSEVESVPMIKMLVKHLLWDPRGQEEICCFSIPSAPIDRDQDTIYHRSVFEGILKRLGFKPLVIEEGYAVVLSELSYKDFTGIGISCGGGLINICAAFKSVPAISFSISRGGDWIDKSAAAVLGIPSSQVTAIKEQGINLKNPLTREQEAIAIYYRDYIHYFLENMAQVFGKGSNTPQFKESVDIVLAGGSTMVGGFLEVAKEELTSVDLGFPVSNVKKAEEPFTSVARGCLFNAIYSGKEQLI